MRVLVTGGTGFRGRSTVRALVEAGHKVPPAGSLDFVLRNARAVDTSRATRDLGLVFRPLDDTFSDTIRWWAARGVIDPTLAGRLAPG